MAKWKNKSGAADSNTRHDQKSNFALPPMENSSGVSTSENDNNDMTTDDLLGTPDAQASGKDEDFRPELPDRNDNDSDNESDSSVELADDVDENSSGIIPVNDVAEGDDQISVDADSNEEDNDATPEVTEELLRQLPKVELHCHLDGSLRVETILELAEKQKVKLPAGDPGSLRNILVVGEDCRSLEDYLKAFEVTLSVMQDAESLERVAYELVEDAAAENIRYLEVRYSPILHTRKGMRLTHIVDAVNDGLRRGERQFNVMTGVIICGMRNINPEISYQLAELAVAYKNRGIVAFDLAGAETDHPAKKHRDAFFLILRNNINCTLHAGESYGPESIHQALHYCGAHRIGHGTRLKEDGDLLNYVNDHRIPLEICLTSNVQTRATKSFSDHPLRFYYDYGLRTTINTDNRLMSDTTISKELFRAHLHLGFELDELIDLILFGFKSAFLPYRTKARMLSKVYDDLRAMNLRARTQRICDADGQPDRL